MAGYSYTEPRWNVEGASLREIFTIEIRKKLAVRTGQGNRIKAKRHDKFAALFVDFAESLIV
jgi:hypothetical protein